jgi:hypothetical protein
VTTGSVSPVGHLVILHRNTEGAAPAALPDGGEVPFCTNPEQGQAKSYACQEIKGAARRSVRPKSREETPKEGSETSDEVTGLAPLI